MANLILKVIDPNLYNTISVTNWVTDPDDEVLKRVFTRDVEDALVYPATEISGPSEAKITIGEGDGVLQVKNAGPKLYLSFMGHNLVRFEIRVYKWVNNANSLAHTFNYTASANDISAGVNETNHLYELTSGFGSNGVSKIEIDDMIVNSNDDVLRIGHIAIHDGKNFEENFVGPPGAQTITPVHKEVSSVFQMQDGSYRKINVNKKRDYQFEFFIEESNANFGSGNKGKWKKLLENSEKEDFYFVYDTDNLGVWGTAGYYFLDPNSQIGETFLGNLSSNPRYIRGKFICAG